MKKIMSLSLLLLLSQALCNDNVRIVHIPAQGSAYTSSNLPAFYFNNNNSQHLTTIESTRTQAAPAPIIIHVPVLPAPQPPAIPLNPPFNPPQEVPTIISEKSSLYGFGGFKSLWNSFPQSFFSLKTGTLLAGTVVTLYSMLWIPFLKHAYTITQKRGWASFQEQISLYHLQTLPLTTISEGLLEEIKKRYPTDDIANIMPGLLHFNKDIEYELEQLQSSLSFYIWLSDYKLSLFFPNQKKLISQARSKIQRLNLFKEAVSQWLHAHLIKSRSLSAPYFKPMMEQSHDRAMH